MKNILIFAALCMIITLNPGCSEAGNEMDHIKIDGKNFISSSGEVMVFHGLNLSDPDKLEKQGKWTLEHFQTAKNWGADMIRLPVHPAAWRTRGTE
jgi:hypothetical protein